MVRWQIVGNSGVKAASPSWFLIIVIGDNAFCAVVASTLAELEKSGATTANFSSLKSFRNWLAEPFRTRGVLCPTSGALCLRL